jgi:hypothetical protein
MQQCGKVPRHLRRLDLGFGVVAFQEQTPGLRSEEGLGQLEHPRQRRKGARTDHVRLKPVSTFAELFNSHGVDVHWRLGLAHDLGEECAFLVIAFDQMHAETRLSGLEDGDDKTREARP